MGTESRFPASADAADTDTPRRSTPPSGASNAAGEPSPARRLVSVLQRLKIGLFGYDAFISYAHKDGLGYAMALENRLAARDYTVFRDAREMPAGTTLASAIARGLKRSRMLVVVATDGAAASENVRAEIEDFARAQGTRRPVIGICLGEDATLWPPLRPYVFVERDVGTLVPPMPSNAVIEQIVANREHRLVNSLARWLGGVVALTLVALTVAVVRQTRAQAAVAESQRVAAVVAAAERAEAAVAAPLLAEQPVAVVTDRSVKVARRILELPIPETVIHEEANIDAVGWSADGSRIVVGSEDGTARLYAADGVGTPALLDARRFAGRSKIADTEEQLTNTPSHEAVLQAELSSDGRRAVLLTRDGTLTVWRLDGTQPVCERSVSTAPASYIRETHVFALAPDGSGLFLVTKQGVVARLRWGDQEPTVLALPSDVGQFISVHLDSSGRHGAALSLTALVVFEIDRPERSQVLSRPDAEVGPEDSWFRFSPEGARIAYVDRENRVRLRSLGDGREVIDSGVNGDVTGAFLSEDALLLGGWSSPMQTLARQGRDWRGYAMFEIHEEVAGIDVDPLRGRALVNDQSDRARLYHFIVPTHRPGADALQWALERVQLQWLMDIPLGHATFSPDGGRLLTHDLRVIYVWSSSPPDEPAMVGNPAATVTALAVGRARPIFAYAEGGTISVVEVTDSGAGTPLSRPGRPQSKVVALAFDTDDRGLLACDEDGVIRRWRWGGADVGERTIASTGSKISSCKRSQDGTRVVVIEHDGMGAAVYDADSGQVVGSAIRNTRYWMRADLAPDARHAVVDVEGSPHWVDFAAVTSGSTPATSRRFDARCAVSTAFSGDGRWIAMGLDSRCVADDARAAANRAGRPLVELWRATGGDGIYLDGNHSTPKHVEFSPDDRRLLAAGEAGDVGVWTLGRANPDLVFDHAQPLTDARWSQNGRFVLTAGSGAVKVWRTDHAAEPVVISHEKAERAAFLPGDRWIVSSSEDYGMRLSLIDWPLLLERLRKRTTACLTVAERERYLGELPELAQSKWEKCEQEHGRR